MMSPLYSCGAAMSTSIIGSSSDGFTFSIAARNALRPAALNECSSESTGWNEPSTSCTLRSEEHTSELQSRLHLVCRLLHEKKKNHESKPEPPAFGRLAEALR